MLMESFGVVERKPKSKKHLNYEQLDLKSIRILNRITKYLEKVNFKAEEAFA